MHLVQITHTEGIEPRRGDCASRVFLYLLCARYRDEFVSDLTDEFIVYFRTLFGQPNFIELSDCCNY